MTELNPFKPGAGHMPPYLAGRNEETEEFRSLLKQKIILNNMVLTGLMGVGKTVLLGTFKPLAQADRWIWVGTDLSESASVNEETFILRLFTDLSVVTSNVPFEKEQIRRIGFDSEAVFKERFLNFNNLVLLYKTLPGLPSDKLKNILELIWENIKDQGIKGIIFAYDEAQTMSNHQKKEQYPLSLLLDVFQSIQAKDIPFMLVLAGLPTLFPQLVEARTFAERMFHVVFLSTLKEPESRDAIIKPLKKQDPDTGTFFKEGSINLIIQTSGGYPYFIQFICREVFDIFLQNRAMGKSMTVPMKEITNKLDTDFFAGRWGRATDRQRELLSVIAQLENCDTEFSVQDIVEISKEKLPKPFSSSHVNQMLLTLSNNGLVYKNRYGRYSFAVPLLGDFVLRQDISQTPSCND